MAGQKRMVLSGLFQPPAFARGAWRLPEVPLGSEIDIDHYAEMAQLCEKGRFDLFFIADSPATRTDNLHVWSRQPFFQNGLEPMTVLSALARSTKHIGLGGTVSTSFFEPYNIARQFASLDHISRGRAAWNVVTSANDYAARNFGMKKLPPHSERYQRARESLAVVKAYWDTWEDDAFVYDKATPLFFDPQKFHPVDFKGEYFSLTGGLNVARTPQGHPLIIQAGSSEAGRELAAETADLVFGIGGNKSLARDFYEDVKGRMEKYGRPRDQLVIISGFSVSVGDSEEEARARREEIEALVPVETRLMTIREDLEVDVFELPLDEPIPLSLIPASANQHQAYFNLVADMARKGMTLREIAKAYRRGTAVFAGTPMAIADHLEDWFRHGGSDGFMINFTHSPGNVVDFVDKVVPELQRRGLVQQDYAEGTLRTKLGLARPANPHAGPVASQ